MAATAAEIAGVPVHAMSRTEVVTEILEAATGRRPLALHLCNAYVLALASRDASYRSTLAAGDLNVADGAAVGWALRLLGQPIRGARPSGTELVDETMRRSVGTEVRHYLYGSTTEVVEGMARALMARHGGVAIVGAESPPFRDLTDDEYRSLLDRVRSSGASVVWIGTGTPKQDLVTERLRQDLVAVLVPVGAAFDFISGAKRRAPAWMRSTGLEWIHRLGSEPGRLWKRYLFGNVIFLVAVLRSWLATRRS